MKRHTIEYIKNETIKFDYEVLSKNYKSVHHKIIFKCPNGHIYKYRWDAFYRGERCKKCKKDYISNLMIEEIKSFCEKIDYICLSTEYVNAHEKLIMKCPKGHNYNVSWNNFKNPNGRRCSICKAINNSGPNNITWKGGISNEPYCSLWTHEFKEIIKERDGNKCLNPVCNNGRHLAVHHVNYNKKCCDKENLITLCRSCNSKANFDREWHKSWYQAILFRRYNYMH